MKSVLDFSAQTVIRVYQVTVSPLIGPRCRYHPTCSAYASQAVKRHGIFKGGLLVFLRILKCHPWAGCHWHDPVPEAFAWKNIFGYKRRQK